MGYFARTRIDVTLFDILPIPLTNARTTSVGKNETADILECSHLTITGNGGTNLLRTGSNSELALGRQAVLGSFTCDRSSAGHVLVRRVGARTDESNLEFLGPLVLLDCLSELRERSSQVRGEGAVDVGLELRKVL